MYIAISPQKMGNTYTSSVGAYVDYLEKEDIGKRPDLKENFFDQYNNQVSQERYPKSRTGRNQWKCKKAGKKNRKTVRPSTSQTEGKNDSSRNAKRGFPNPRTYHRK